VRLQHRGRRERFNLETPNRAVAAARALDIYRYLLVNGWEAALEKFKPHGTRATGPIATVGDLIEALRRVETGNPQTFADYVGCFRRVVAAAGGIVGDKRRYDVHQGGRAAWLQKVDAVRLEEITPEKVRLWKKRFLDAAGSNRIKQRSARVTVNSTMRLAGALFSERRLRAAGLTIASPFEGVEYERNPSTRYHSSFSIAELTEAARTELAGEEFKCYLLATFAGLRQDEIDKLHWSAFRWDQGVLRIEPTPHFGGKSQESIADVDLEPEVLEIFRGFRARATGPFVIESSVPPRLTVTYRHHRCRRTFRLLCAWLRAHGVAARTPLHALRKEFGSQVCDRLGIYAASQALRHSGVRVTEAHYIERRRRIVPGLGHLLKQPQNITPLTLANLDTPAGQPERASG
jgi:hypothetical protein